MYDNLSVYLSLFDFFLFFFFNCKVPLAHPLLLSLSDVRKTTDSAQSTPLGNGQDFPGQGLLKLPTYLGICS